MHSNENPYSLRKEVISGLTHYYVAFYDGQAMLWEAEVSRLVYLEFLRFSRHERNQLRWSERHIEQSALTDETLFKRAFQVPKSVEDDALDKQLYERLRNVVRELPEIQRRRFILRYEFDLTYEQIAKIEGCSHVSVSIAVKRAERKIKEAISFFENQV
jgi:RNA polymerase sigma-70 factor (ECF subfamily)